MVGAGAVGRGGGGGLDISNLVKPALARGDLQCIGATTLDEHRKYIERDTALERRFQPVTIGEPTAEDTVAILQGLKDRYERHHHCLYDHDALDACAMLSERCVCRVVVWVRDVCVYGVVCAWSDVVRQYHPVSYDIYK